MVNRTMDRTNGVKVLGSGLFEVPSFTNPRKKYVVDLREKSCTCPAYRFRGYCKHLKFVEENFGEPEEECEIEVIREGALGYKILYNGERW